MIMVHSNVIGGFYLDVQAILAVLLVRFDSVLIESFGVYGFGKFLLMMIMDSPNHLLILYCLTAKYGEFKICILWVLS